MGRHFYTKAYLDKQNSLEEVLVPGDDIKSEPDTEKKTKSQDTNSPIVDTPHKKTAKERKPVVKPKPKINNHKDGRAIEIEQLSRRFSDLQVQSTTDTVTSLHFNLPITDPDFPYDLPVVELRVDLPAEYPQTPPHFTVLNDTIPETIKQRLNSRLNETAQRCKPGEMSVRPVLRYLENNLEAIIVAKTAIKFIPPGAITVSPRQESAVGGVDVEGRCDSASASTQRTTTVTSNSIASDHHEELKVRECRFEPACFVKLQDRQELGGGSFTLEVIQNDPSRQAYTLLILYSLSVTVICEKCDAMTDIVGIRMESERLQNCHKCRRQMTVSFYPQYMTMSSSGGVVGQCKFVKCRPLDLMPSQWQMDCPRCDQNVNGESGVRVNRVTFGEAITYPCRRCGTVMSLLLDGCRWTSNHINTLGDKKSAKRDEKVAVTIGEPLPAYGACQHYTKSFRWYRFPCCGRVFSCDRCHDEHPQSKGHAMEWATRFLCGWCSREQHINNVNKVCQCGVDPTRRHTAHWEGGRGMREQQTMSRKDNKKYRGMSR